MSKLVDKVGRLAAMANLAKHFLSQAYEGGNTAEEREARHDAMKDEVAPCGLFDIHDVVWLFYLLEERALTEINKFALLAQTTDPDVMLKHGVPAKLVENAKLLKGHHGKTAKADSARSANATKTEVKQGAVFIKWVKENLNKESHSGQIRIADVKKMDGFDAACGELKDDTIRKKVKDAIPGFKFKHGAEKKEKK